MGIEDFLISLRGLETLIERFDSAKNTMENAEEQIRVATHHFPSKLKEFDNKTKEPFILRCIGAKPQEKFGFKNIVAPGFAKRSFGKKVKEYEEKRLSAEKEYEKKYAKQRNEIKASDDRNQAKAIEEAELRFIDARALYHQAQKDLSDNDTLTESLKQKKTVSRLISYIEEGRVENHMQAINLWYEEKRKDDESEKEEAHRRKMEEYAKAEYQAAQKAEENAKMAAESARQAEENARQAAENARQASENARQAIKDAQNLKEGSNHYSY